MIAAIGTCTFKAILETYRDMKARLHLLQSLTPLVEGILRRDMQRFAQYATEH